MPGPWEQYANPVASPTSSAPSNGPWTQYQPAPSLSLDHDQAQRATDALVYSHMTGAPPSYTYENRDAFNEDFSTRLEGYASAGWKGLTQDSIIGEYLRGRTSGPFETDDEVSKFIEGFGTMIGDLPEYLVGGGLGMIAGGAAGTAELPVVGTISGGVVGAGAGGFGLTAGLRQWLVDKYAGKQISAFDEVMDVIKATGKGALTGTAFSFAGEAAPLAEGTIAKVFGARAYKTAAELATMTTVGSLLEGKVPTARDFASNAALLALMHVTVGNLPFAKKASSDLQEKSMDLYARDGVHPADLASEAARRAVGEQPSDNPMEVMNKIDNELRGIPGKTPEAEAPADAPKGETSIKNEVTEAERAERGLPEVEVEARQTPAFEAGKKAVDEGTIDPRSLAKELADNPRPHTDEEAAALIYDRMKLQNQHATAMNTIEAARASGDEAMEARGKAQLAKVEDAMNTNDEAARRSGTETGRALAARRMMIKQDYSLANVLQRARVASPNGEVSPELRNTLETLTKQLDEANKRIDDYEETKKQQTAERAVEKIRKGLSERTEKRTATKESRKAERDILYKKLNEELTGQLSANPMLNPKLYELFGKLAVSHIEDGLTTIEQIVDEIHSNLQERGISKREIRDYISQYGRQAPERTKDEVQVQLREAMKQGKLISAIEDAESGEQPAKGKAPGKPSERVKELRKQLDEAMKKEEPVEEKTDEGGKREAARQKAVEKSISELDRRIKDKDLSPTQRMQGPDTETLDSLKEQRDSLREAFDEMKSASIDKGGTKEAARAKALQKSIAELERRIKERDTSAPAKMQGPDTEEAASLKARRDALRETLDSMKVREKADPATRALRAYKTRITKRIADLQKQLDTGDFAKPTRGQTVLDQQAQDLKAQSEKLKGQVDDAIHKQKLAARTPLEKGAAIFQKWRRAVLLSSVNTLGKLTTAAMMRFGTTPIEELIGGVLSKMPGLSDIAEKAPREGGGLNISAEAKAFGQFFEKATYQDIKEAVKTGKTSLDYLYGKKETLPPEALDFFGHLHGALKVLPKRAEFFRSLEKRAQWALDNHLDINDPKVQATMAADAYTDANRAIFMQENFINTGFRMLMGEFHSQGLSGKSTEFMIKTVLPIVKVPTNIVAETGTFAAGTVTGSINALRVLVSKDGLKNLTGHEADNIMRSLKKGSIGLAVLAMGYYAGASTGFIQSTGFYQPGDEKKEKKAETLTIGGVDVPPWIQHTPVGLVFEMGATMRRVNDAYTMKGKSGGFVAGASAAALGTAKKVPFLEEATRLGEATHTADSAGLFLDDLIESLIVPPDVRRVAQMQDPQNKQRKPTNLEQTIEKSVPGMQENVPTKNKGRKFSIRGGYR